MRHLKKFESFTDAVPELGKFKEFILKAIKEILTKNLKRDQIKNYKFTSIDISGFQGGTPDEFVEAIIILYNKTADYCKARKIKKQDVIDFIDWEIGVRPNNKVTPFLKNDEDFPLGINISYLVSDTPVHYIDREMNQKTHESWSDVEYHRKRSEEIKERDIESKRREQLLAGLKSEEVSDEEILSAVKDPKNTPLLFSILNYSIKFGRNDLCKSIIDFFESNESSTFSDEEKFWYFKPISLLRRACGYSVVNYDIVDYLLNKYEYSDSDIIEAWKWCLLSKKISDHDKSKIKDILQSFCDLDLDTVKK